MGAYADEIKSRCNGNEIQIYENGLAGSTWTNEAKNDHHLDVVSGTIETSGGPGSSLTHYLSLNGSSDYAQASHNVELDIEKPGSHGVFVWVPATSSSDEWACVVSKGYEFRHTGADQSILRWSPSAGNGPEIEDVPSGEWVFYGMTVGSTGNASIRRRRASDSQMSSAVIASDDYGANTEPFTLGRRASGGRYFHGRIAGYFAADGIELVGADFDAIYESATAVGIAHARTIRSTTVGTLS